MKYFLLLLTIYFVNGDGTGFSRQRSKSDGGIATLDLGNTPNKVQTIPEGKLQLNTFNEIHLKKIEAKIDKILEQIEGKSRDISEIKTDLGYILESLIPSSCSTASQVKETPTVVQIKPPKIAPAKVCCLKDTSGAKWTVVLRRENGLESFNRTYKEYQQGFGDPNEEYWIGNEMLHALTAQSPHLLKVEFETFGGKKAVAYYNTFSVGAASTRYKLTVKNYDKKLSTAGDGLEAHDQMKFSTFDQDEDNKKDQNCAVSLGGKGGWWYNTCYHVLGTGKYRKTQGNEFGGIHWYPMLDVKHSLKNMIMAIKPL